MSYPYIIQGGNLVVVIGNVPHTVSKTHITYDKLVAAIKASDWDAVKDLIEPKKVLLKYAEDHVTIDGDQFLWRGKPMDNSLSRRMIEMLKEGFPITPMVKFINNLMENPSKRAVTELYGFLEKSNLPITPDGHFLAYKKVRADYLDCHSGTMDNSVGQVVEMERNMVDDDKEVLCSQGLHFCSIDYLKSFSGARTIILRINPRDVVSIPVDYNDSKGRACRYTVIGELDAAPETAFDKPVQSNAKVVKPGAWPFPNGGAEPTVVKTGGHPLSMTPNAIRKRAARAAKKAAYAEFQATYKVGKY